MKNATTFLASIVLLALSLGATAAQAQAVYRFEVYLAGLPEALTVRTKAGETQTVGTTGNSWEFTSAQTTLAKSDWEGMAKAGTAPDHDFVSCSKTLCTYGKNAKIIDSVNVSVRPTEQNGAVLAAVVYDRSQTKRVIVTKGMRTPDIEGFHSRASLAMKVGDELPISENGGLVAMVKFVGME